MREDSSSDLFTNTELLWEGGLNQKELFDEKIARLRDADERNQNKTKDNKQSDRVPGPLTSANGTERHNVWVRL
jgi:hypothetical protein